MVQYILRQSVLAASILSGIFNICRLMMIDIITFNRLYIMPLNRQ